MAIVWGLLRVLCACYLAHCESILYYYSNLTLVHLYRTPIRCNRMGIHIYIYAFIWVLVTPSKRLTGPVHGWVPGKRNQLLE